MSGLERFQGTSDWMQRFKSLLTSNRDQKTPPRDLDSSEENSFSLELSEDFLTVLDQRNIPKTMTTSFQADNKENMNPISKKDITNISYNNIQTKRISVYEDSIMNPSFADGTECSFEITNLSFSAIEQACNKSVSDPDSTIHKYVEQIRKNNESKNSNVTENSLQENEAIDRLIKDLEREELKYISEDKKIFSKPSNNSINIRTTMGFGDQTQLADIEEPSALWETTVSDNPVKYHISPTKMVGLLRPSTILEESFSSNLTESNATENSNSFNTATKLVSDQTNDESDATSQYETAYESAQSDVSNVKNGVKVSNDNDSSKGIGSGVSQQQDSNDNKTNNSKSEGSSETSSNSVNSSENVFNYSLKSHNSKNVIHLHNHEIKQEISFAKTQLQDLSQFTIEISDDEENESQNENGQKEQLNEGFSIQDIQSDNNDSTIIDETLKEMDSKDDKGLNISREFNDTLEEVEYIMKHGMQMLINSATKPKLVESVVIRQNRTPQKLSVFSNSKEISPISKNISPRLRTPKASEFSANTPANKNMSNETYKFPKSPSLSQKVFSPKYNVNTPPFKNSPSLLSKTLIKQASVKKIPTSASKDTFRKPNFATNMTRIPHSKPISNIKKSFYADVISPVGAYIKKTPVCPTETKIKETTIKSLDYGQATGKATLQYHPPKRFEMKKGNGPSLPQKCYKSAEYKCVVDERTPLNIPGGEKIHKYLKPALLPAVVRHDGKMKMNTPTKYTAVQNNNINKTVDSTMTDLADLSTISGDVSIYTLRDAQKFTFANVNNIGCKK